MKKIIKIIIIAMSIITLGLMIGCSKEAISSKAVTNEPLNPPKELPIATIKVKDYGIIEAELYPHLAPNTVNNFIELANNKFYDGLIFHRVVKDFVIQGGDPEGTGIGGPGYFIKGEFEDNAFKNDIKHERGVLSMARSQHPDSAGSQFFIVTKDSPSLNKQYAAFGKVIKGMDVVDKIEVVKVGNQEKPIKNVVIESIRVDTKGIDYKKAEKIK